MSIAPPIPLAAVAAAVDGAEVRDEDGVVVDDVSFDSREVRPGSLFFCVPGATSDGHSFAAAAASGGAAALVVERWLELELPQVRVRSVREAMGPMSATVFGRPAEALTIVGVTGTNGKTTTTYLLESVFAGAGLVPGTLGTTGARIAGQPLPLARTTPEAPDLHRLLARMRDRGVTTVAMEVSSHALVQERVGGVRFDVAAFTNLSQDHLDFHPDMETYFAAKASLFRPGRAAAAAIGIDDEHGRRLRAAVVVPALTFGLSPDADLRATDVIEDATGISFRVGTLAVSSPLLGAFNVRNCLCVLAICRLLGIADDAVTAGIAAMPGVPGRAESVDEGQDFLVVVDYAHTPDSIQTVLTAARHMAPGRVIAVFGCGGDRDRAKRTLMGAAATSVADLTIITSDNPRSEDPGGIIAEIEPGARRGGGRYVVEPDRRGAIRLAIREASEGDVVVIAGKGHEQGQTIGTRTHPFDDRTVAAEELRASWGGRR
ncbi:MAG: UDP-N-acetylmuramoyl-L-alanyl-D-glutamate--2,6-diaminopimelate ligase [Actinomycetota bacterium]